MSTIEAYTKLANDKQLRKRTKTIVVTGADHGFESQQTNEAEDPQRPDNLWEPVDGDFDHGCHGRFDRLARDYSPLFYAEKHHLACLAAAASALAAIGLGYFFARNR